MNFSKLRSISFCILGMILISMPSSHGFTDLRDISAVNDLYRDLGSPPLPRWRLYGDPCLESWHGVECSFNTITRIILVDNDLGGHLSDSLGSFPSLITLDLSNNHIGGEIPANLPSTIREFFLSSNNLTGTIPKSLSKLRHLTKMTVNDNLLEGDLPDVFQSLTALVNLDVSSNNLSGRLPPSMGNLSALTTLNMQNNHLSGALDVLADLPLVDLNIENNLFSGWIPPKLHTIPKFQKDGNSFVDSIDSVLPSTSPSPLPPPIIVSDAPAPSVSSQFEVINLSGDKKGKSIWKVIAYAVITIASFIVVVLTVTIFILKVKVLTKEDPPIMLKCIKSAKSNLPTTIIKCSVPEDDTAEEPKEHFMDITKSCRMRLHRPFEFPKLESQTTKVTSFSVALLQQYTKGFTKENLIWKDSVSKTYLGELPDGKLLTVVNLDNASLKIEAGDFLSFISVISELRSPYIMKLVGYCMEYDQRVLVYNYFSETTLHDILHGEAEFKKNLSWNARVKIAFGAARALEYLHECCHPPVTYKTFNSSKILVDEFMYARVSECGLASLTTSIYNNQVHEEVGSEAPEVSDGGSCTDKSDVYSFGVVMLELLTGRKPYESWRPEEEGCLVRWASSKLKRLYDIDSLLGIVDPALKGEVAVESLLSFADIARRCVQWQPKFREAMSEVAQDLTNLVDGEYEYCNTTHSQRSLSGIPQMLV